MKIYKLYSNVIAPKFGTHNAACFDIHAHLRGPLGSEDVPPIVRSIKWYDCNNKLHETVPITIFESDIPRTKFELEPNCRALIPTGMVMDIPVEYSGRIHPRSGIAWKHGVTLINCEGVIDSDYREEVYIPLYNTTNVPYVITHGDRIAQMEILRSMYQVNHFTFTEATPQKSESNRTGGFGSTGV